MTSLPEELRGAVQTLSEDYTDFEANERGANGYLLFAKNRISNATVAIKFYAGEPGEGRHDEPRQLSAINSPNVLPILDARNVTDEWAYFITPRCLDGDLDGLIDKRPSMHRAIDVALGICAGVGAIHANGMVHRDLKPANIVMDQGNPRIADFGSVRAIATGMEDTRASRHSLLYRPPESFEPIGRYGFRGDIYQLGLVTYQLLGGELPYEAVNYLTPREIDHCRRIADSFEKSRFMDAAIFRLAQKRRLMRLESLPVWVNTRARSALRWMTRPDPCDRPSSVAEVAALLSQLRSTSADWSWVGQAARLVADDRVIELRPVSNGMFGAFQSIAGNPFRKMAGIPSSSLSDLFEQLKL